MRRFVIRNRKKRKYIKRTFKTTSYSFSHSIYSLLPLLIMCITFLSTLVISKSFRDSVLSIHFNLQYSFYEIKFIFYLLLHAIAILFQFILYITHITTIIVVNSNNLQSQIINIILSNIYTFTISLITFFTKSSSQLILQTEYSYMHYIKQLNPQPFIMVIVNSLLFLSNIIWSNFVILIKCIYIIYNISLNLIIIIDSSLLSAANYFFLISTHLLINVFITIINLVKYVVLSLYSSTLILFHFLLVSINTLYQNYIQIFSTIKRSISSTLLDVFIFLKLTVTYILYGLIQMVNKIIYTIEIPFKIVFAFGLLLKPYFDIFTLHIRMSGEDFSNTLSDFSKIIVYLNTSK